MYHIEFDAKQYKEVILLGKRYNLSNFLHPQKFNHRYVLMTFQTYTGHTMAEQSTHSSA